MTEPITIRAFRAIDEPETCQKFYKGHIDALRSFGVEPISSAKIEWIENPNVFGVIAEYNNKILGGVKLHRYDYNYKLPIENSVGYLDDKIFKIIEKNRTKNLGELCGLWNTREIAGRGLGYVLLRALVVITSQVQVDTLISLSSDHTIKMLRGLGYRVIRTLGNNGEFLFPTKDYIARVMILNSKTLSWALPYNKTTMLSLRDKPEQFRIESGNKGKINVKYNLNISVLV
ncbi:MAG: GNAT family N-acetyltransferase [Chitinophagales bacterium]